jgi:hypothetical protein
MSLTERSTMLCKLCHEEEVIENSHIIPAFVGRWIKDTSPLHGLRDADNPNERQQDISKIPLLGSKCEDRFGKREKTFQLGIFLPFNDSGQREFDYSDWRLYFAISLSWRVGQHLYTELQAKNPTMVGHLDQALQIWSDVLLEKPGAVSPYSHHLFFDSVYRGIVLFAGPHYDERYALGSAIHEIPHGKNDLAISVKLPGMIFYSGIHPADPTGWKNTRIFDHGRIGTKDQVVNDQFFWTGMQESTADLAKKMDCMSDRQKQKLNEKMESPSTKPKWQIRKERETKT